MGPRSRFFIARSWAAGFILLLVAACGTETQPVDAGDPTSTGHESSGSDTAVRHVDNWQGIRERGVIRFADRRFRAFTTLPRQGLPVEHFHRLAERFAARHQLDVEWVIVDGFDELLPALDAGLADVVVANLTVTESRAESVSFTRALTHSHEWLVGRELATVGVPRETAYIESLAAHRPELDVVLLPAGLDPSAVVLAIEKGEIDATVMDEPVARTAIAGRPNMKKLGEIPGQRELAWAHRRGDPALKSALDAFLLESHVVGAEDASVRAWRDIVASGRLRMGTVNDPTTYYLWRGELLGFEYELAKVFADRHELVLEVVVAESIDELLELVTSGRVDYVSASLSPTSERRALGVAFTAPYMTINEAFVTALDPIEGPEALRDRAIVVNPSTSYASTLRAMTDQAFRLVEDPRSPTSILNAVLDGELDATLLDSHRAELTATFDDRISIGHRLEPGKSLAWGYAAGNVGIGEALDAFIKDAYRGYDYNVLRSKYFKNKRRMARQREDRVTGRDLSPFDDLVKAAVAEQEEGVPLDWRLVIAQMYQESGFDPEEVSFAGARGLLQMMPRTAREIGVDPDRLHEPRVGIDAGVEYLRWTMDHFPELSPGERIWFALASYNAGVGHVRDARLLAEELDLDDSLWFENVEVAMLKLAEPRYARKAMYGYVRGTEPYKYVREIRELYRAYLDHFRVLDAGEDA